jgi:Flp pilus assembly protein TadG
MNICARFRNPPAFARSCNTRRPRWSAHGQASVELALVTPIVVVLLVVAIQFALIGSAALSLSQINYQGARWAAVNCTSGGTCATQSDVQTYMLNNASPLIRAASGRYFSSTTSPAPPCSYGNSVTVSVTFDTSGLVILPNPFLGIPFPRALSSSQSAFCEG